MGCNKSEPNDCFPLVASITFWSPIYICSEVENHFFSLKYSESLLRYYKGSCEFFMLLFMWGENLDMILNFIKNDTHSYKEISLVQLLIKIGKLISSLSYFLVNRTRILIKILCLYSNECYYAIYCKICIQLLLVWSVCS